MLGLFTQGEVIRISFAIGGAHANRLQSAAMLALIVACSSFNYSSALSDTPVIMNLLLFYTQKKHDVKGSDVNIVLLRTALLR